MILPMMLLASWFAFSPAQDVSGDLTLEIADMSPITALERPIPVVVRVRNQGSQPVTGEITLEVIDRWRVEGTNPQSFQVNAQASAELKFACVAGKGTYAAHYPIHARASVQTPQGETSLHAVLVVEVAREAVTQVQDTPSVPEVRTLAAPGALSLLDLTHAQVRFTVGGRERDLRVQPVGWSGADPETGTWVHIASIERGDRRQALGVHPPWRTGWGVAYVDTRVQLPKQTPILLVFATAIRDHRPGREPPSDGVLFEVWVQREGEKRAQRLFERFSDAKRWEDAQIDLSAYAGQTVRLTLVTHPGPKHDTTCDQAYWAEPVLLAGIRPRPAESEAKREARRRESLRRAQAAASGERVPLTWTLGEGFGAALVPGPTGVVDAMLSFATSRGTLTFEGVPIQIDGRRLDDWRGGFLLGPLEVVEDTLRLPLRDGSRRYTLIARLWADQGGLRLQIALEGITPDDRGHPRLTSISLGPVDQTVRRFYGGHGNVLEDPGKLRLPYNGFALSTSFVGFDFANGVSLVQATDIPPDAAVVDPERHLATLEAHHALTLTLVPSTDGAFDAARKYRVILRPRPAGGVIRLLGRMNLDQWGGDYARAAEDLERAARYGLTDSVFVKHVWQRWGYDYRLPDIFPPAGNGEDFQRMVEVCRRNGILFAPHDNYIDFYPDASGFSYQHIIFNPDGTPQRAWYNKGRDAQSYRWLPHAFQPWMERNLSQIAAQIQPTAYFIDVFSAIAPMDYYDEQGRFYPKRLTIQKWGEAFDWVREVLDGAPTISEAGHDALVGHLDAAEADHQGWDPTSERWSWRVPARDGERIPWHDMVTHGAFVLFAGGLGHRYAGGASTDMHGYGSDDYLSMTVLGGRNPMCDGPFNRRAVMTYWLLHDLCAALAQREFTRHTFLEDNIHLQRAEFGDDAWVVVNRSDADWTFEGQTLPRYGFIAQAGDVRADILRREGIITAFAESPEALFIDARPPEHSGGLPLHVEILGVASRGGRRFVLRSRWVVQSPIQEPGRPYLHFTNAQVAPEGEHIAFQASFPIGPEQWKQIGVYEVDAEGEIPEDLPVGEYEIRFGIYQPERGGRRLLIPGPRDATRRRLGGTLIVREREDGQLAFDYRPPSPDEATQRLNLARQLVDFGPVITNGAFRLLKRFRLLIPLPDSADFEVILKLDALGYPSIQRVEALDEEQNPLHEVAIHTQGTLLHFTAEGGVFAYRLVE